jgi:hypothetical protein
MRNETVSEKTALTKRSPRSGLVQLLIGRHITAMILQLLNWRALACLMTLVRLVDWTA